MLLDGSSNNFSDNLIPMGPPEVTKPPETKPDLVESVRSTFLELKKLADGNTGLFPAVNPDIQTPESQENEMQYAWIRDSAFILMYTAEVAERLQELEPQNQTATEMQEFIKDDLGKLLEFLNQPRWLDAFNQEIADEDAYTRLTEQAPEVHMGLDGIVLQWDHNQPEAWADLLLAACRAKASGAVENYTDKATQTIRTMTEYLIRIKPWKFQGAAMWEGTPVHSPASRSNALAIAKSLEAADSFFQDDETLSAQIKQTIATTMNFVRENVNADYTFPEGHPDGADLAMLVAMGLPSSEATELDFLKYLQDNSNTLGIGDLPGAKRFEGDEYYKGELGEARWFMANPILAIGYFDEAEKAINNSNLELAEKYYGLGLAKLRQAEEISNRYGYENHLYPELFTPRNPELIENDPDTLIFNDGDEKVALQPLKRSLLWNSALMMVAKTKAQKLEGLFRKYQDYSYPIAA